MEKFSNDSCSSIFLQLFKNPALVFPTDLCRISNAWTEVAQTFAATFWQWPTGERRQKCRKIVYMPTQIWWTILSACKIIVAHFCRHFQKCPTFLSAIVESADNLVGILVTTPTFIIKKIEFHHFFLKEKEKLFFKKILFADIFVGMN